MKGIPYPVEAEDSHTFHFISEGPKGLIEKVVRFERFTEDTYNLGFGDKTGREDDFDDHTVSNNGDLRKVLTTIVSVVVRFLENNPGAWIYIEGSTPVRQRLYERILKQYRNEFEQDYWFWGGKGFYIEPFQNRREYEFLLISKRKV